MVSNRDGKTQEASAYDTDQPSRRIFETCRRVPTDGEGDEKSSQQGDLEPDGREMASMRGQSKKPKSCDARPRAPEAAGQF
jgi:hypothetical protein